MKTTQIHYKGSEYNKDGDRPVKFDDTTKVMSDKQLRKALKDKDLIFIKLTEKELLGFNKLKYRNKRFLLLEPNPVTFYFSLAFDAVDQFAKAKALLDNSLQNMKEPDVVAFSYVFKVASVGVIFSFFALEAFMNQMLPDYALINYDGNLVSKDKIQRFVPFDDKINRIIPDLCGKNFGDKYPKKMESLNKLKKMRDEFSHLKEKRKNGFTSYDNVYQDVLNLNLRSIVSNVKLFINFYYPGLIKNYQNKTIVK